MNSITDDTTKEDGYGSQGKKKTVGGCTFLWAYIQASTAKGEIQVISYDGDEATAVKCANAATLAVYQHVGVVMEAHSSAEYGWVQLSGLCDIALVEGTTDVAKDDFLEVLNTEVSAKKDAAARSVNSFAIAREAVVDAGDNAAKVLLLGDRVIIAAT